MQSAIFSATAGSNLQVFFPDSSRRARVPEIRKVINLNATKFKFKFSIFGLDNLKNITCAIYYSTAVDVASVFY